MMRGMLPKVLIAVLFFTCVAVGATGGQTDQGFSTNLGLLSRLAEEAVSSLLDSLDVRPGEKITVVSAVFHEGNDFIAAAACEGSRPAGSRGAYRERVRRSRPRRPPPGLRRPARPRSIPRASPPPPRRTAPAPLPTTLKTRFASDSTAVFPGSTQVSDSLKAEAVAAKDSSATESAPVIEHGIATQAAPAAAQVAPAVAQTAPTVKPYPEGTVLEYRVLEFGVTYPVLKRRFFLFGDASVRRLGGVYLSASRIRGPEGTILKLVEAQSHKEDYLSSRARLRAEGASYPFTKPVVPPANVGKYFEPVAVAGIVTSLVYLFYQNQH